MAAPDLIRYENASRKISSDFSNAVIEKDIATMLKLKYLIEDLESTDNSILHELINGNELYSTNIEKCNSISRQWIENVPVGDKIDVFSEIENKWFESKILSKRTEDETMFIHYAGWHPKYDEHIKYFEKRICPVHVFSKGKKMPIRSNFVLEKSEQEVSHSTISQSEQEINLNLVAMDSNEDIITGRVSRYGRKTRVTNESSSFVLRKRSCGDGEDNVKKEPKDKNDWICGVCGWLEAVDGSDLVLCEGILFY